MYHHRLLFTPASKCACARTGHVSCRTSYWCCASSTWMHCAYKLQRRLMHARLRLCTKYEFLICMLNMHACIHTCTWESQVIRNIIFEGSDRVYLESGPDGKPVPALKRHHKSDGLIFAPNTAYCRGKKAVYQSRSVHVCMYGPGSCKGMCAWKDRESKWRVHECFCLVVASQYVCTLCESKLGRNHMTEEWWVCANACTAQVRKKRPRICGHVQDNLLPLCLNKRDILLTCIRFMQVKSAWFFLFVCVLIIATLVYTWHDRHGLQLLEVEVARHDDPGFWSQRLEQSWARARSEHNLRRGTQYFVRMSSWCCSYAAWEYTTPALNL
jgi:hypothetical protein